MFQILIDVPDEARTTAQDSLNYGVEKALTSLACRERCANLTLTFLVVHTLLCVQVSIHAFAGFEWSESSRACNAFATLTCVLVAETPARFSNAAIFRVCEMSPLFKNGWVIVVSGAVRSSFLNDGGDGDDGDDGDDDNDDRTTE